MVTTVKSSASSGALQVNGVDVVVFDISGITSGLSDALALTKTKTSLNASGAAPIYACRAWVNFNGTGTVAIRASGNVSSITDNAVGDYTVNFLTAMPDADYTTSGSLQAIPGTSSPWLAINGYAGPTLQAPTTTACRVFSQQSGAGYDSGFVCISFFR